MRSYAIRHLTLIVLCASVLLAMPFALGFSRVVPVFANNPEITIKVDGAQIIFPDMQPVIVDDYTLVPMRGVFENMGFYGDWNEQTRTSTLYREGMTVSARIGDSYITVNGERIFPEVPPQVIGGRFMIPLRAVAESTGAVVTWNDSTRTVNISTGDAQVTTPTPLPAPVPTPVPTPQPVEPSINSVSYDRISVEDNQPITVTVVTNTIVNYVWVDLGNRNNVDAALQSQGYGEKRWSATFYPERTADVYVHANTTREAQGSAIKSQGVTVISSAITIDNLSVDRTSINSGESVTFAVSTSAGVNYVWLEYDGISADVTFRYQDSHGYKRWEATVYPRETQRINIYANSRRSLSGAASKTQQITVSVERIEIYSINTDNATINAGQSASLTIETSLGVERVYARYDSLTEFASHYQSSGDRDYWQIDVSPGESQAIYVTAYSRNNQYGSASRTIRITVNPVGIMPVVPLEASS